MTRRAMILARRRWALWWWWKRRRGGAVPEDALTTDGDPWTYTGNEDYIILA